MRCQKFRLNISVLWLRVVQILYSILTGSVS